MPLRISSLLFPDTIHAHRPFKPKSRGVAASSRQPRVLTKATRQGNTMDTSKMSVPHSVVHARSYIDEVEKSPVPSAKSKAEPGVKGMMGAIGKPFQKMRRRLTVTGSTGNMDNIDGVGDSKSLDDKPAQPHSNGHQQHAAPAPREEQPHRSEPREKHHHHPEPVAPARRERRERKHKPTDVRCAVTEYSGVSKKGHAPYNPRKKNQDALIMQDDPATNTLVLCVLDGHGEHGDGVSQTFRDQLIPELFNHQAWTTDLKKACTDAIAKVERNLLRNYRIDSEFSGTTLSMAIVRGNKVLGVNVGDSRVILGKEENGRITYEDITFDHKPDSPAEKERILACGGRVFAVEYDDGIDGPPRVWLGHMDIPGLAMSRSLGDVVAHSAGVISDPEFTEYTLNPNTDRFLVVATDGLWEFCDSQETVEMVEAQAGPTDAVDVLVTEAATRWMHEEQVIDDTTIIVANLFNYKSS